MNGRAHHNSTYLTAPGLLPSRFAPAPNRRHYALATLLLAAFVIYGSIVPLHLQRQTFDQAIERFREVLAQPIVLKSRSDWLANFLLLLPFGFFLMAAICCDRPHFSAPALPVTIVSCLVLAAFVEFAQLYFPPRTSSINDIVAQTIGGTTGALFWLARGQRLTTTARRLWNDFGARGTAALLLPLYLFAVLILQTLPFDFNLSPVEIYHKYKEGRVHLRPFAAFGVDPFETANKHFWNLALFAPVGLLLAHLPGRLSRGGWLVLAFGLLAAGTIEAAQLLAFSRYFDTTDILTGAAAIWVAWYAVQIHRRLRLAPSGEWIVGGSLILVSLAVLIFMEWQPFNFHPSLSEARRRLHQVDLLPFVEYFRGHYLFALDDCVHKILMYGALGGFLAVSAPPSSEAFWFRWSLAVVVAVVMEAGQLFLPTRTPSITDVLIGGVSAGLAMSLVRRARVLTEPARLPQRSIREFSR